MVLMAKDIFFQQFQFFDEQCYCLYFVILIDGQVHLE